MSIFNCSAEMARFQDEEIRLSQSDQKEMRERRNAGRVRLRTGLERDGCAVPTHHAQGSYAMHTMVQDADCDYDIDDGAYFREEDLEGEDDLPLDPRQARERVCHALTQDNRLASEAVVHRNCVRQEYPAGYHIDVPVYRITHENEGEDDEKEIYELASSDAWVRSDARAVTRWFKDRVSELNGDTDDGRQLRWVTRLTKGFARSRAEWKKKTCSGILITRLVVDEFVASPGRDDIALRDTWKRIVARLKLSSVVAHPVNDGNLAEEGDTCVKFLLDKFEGALETLKVLDRDCTRGEARKAWDDVFDTSFFTNQPDPSEDSNKGGRAAFVATESKTDRRDDAGGRYG